MNTEGPSPKLPVLLFHVSQRWVLFQSIVIILSLLWLSFSVLTAQHAQAEVIQIPQKGFSAPNFSLLDTQGQELQLEDFQGQAIILNFWATWCPPCKAEMPDLQNVFIQKQYSGVVVLGVNRTDQDNSLELDRFLESYGITFPVLLDSSGEIAKIYNISALPTTYFIRPDGIIHKVIVGGPLPQALLLAEIQQMIQESP